MIPFWLSALVTALGQFLNWRKWGLLMLSLLVVISSVSVNPSSAIAGLNDDRYDGDIFALYAGNGSFVPPKVSLEQGLARKNPVLLVLYIDDSSDCKRYSTVLSQLQSFYGRVSDFIAIRVDSIPLKSSYAPTEPGYYYTGSVPQTVLFDETGKVVLNQKGALAFEPLDDAFRQVFDLVPRAESVTLKRRAVNEINTELVK